MNKKISVVVPMYFEQEVVNECYNRIKKVLQSLEKYTYEIVFVNDGSKDKTLEMLTHIALEDSNVKVISLTRNFGHQVAVTAGLKYITGDAICIIDADMQDPPEIIPQMLEIWEQGFNIVYGKRKSRKKESIFKRITAKLFYNILNLLSDVEIPKDTGDFRIVDRKVVDTINSMPEHNKFLRGLFSWAGYNQYAFEYERQERIAGKTKYPLKKMLKLAFDGIIGFSTKPIKLLSYFGIFSIILSFILAIYTVIAKIANINTLEPGWASIMVVITFFAGVQLISVWIMAEYVGRIYDESKKRPEYIVDFVINSKKD